MGTICSWEIIWGRPGSSLSKACQCNLKLEDLRTRGVSAELAPAPVIPLTQLTTSTYLASVANNKTWNDLQDCLLLTRPRDSVERKGYLD